MKELQKILCLAPHCDDIEFSCGATIAKFAEEGHEIRIAVFSYCEDSIPDGIDKNILRVEMPRAMKHLGIDKENIIDFNYPVRKFPEHRQDILEDMVRLNQEYRPDLVMLPNSQDIHQDHNTIHKEGLRAFKKTKIIGYEMHWNNFSSANNLYIKVEEKHISLKLKSISEYKSQLFRGLSDADIFWGLAKIRGSQIGSKYAESFEVIRWVI